MIRRKSVKWIFAVVIPALIIIIIATSKEDEISVDCECIRRCSIEKHIPVNGKIQPVESVSISPEVSGEISEIRHYEGEYVNTGDVIIKIKPDLYNSLVERSEATLGSARANLEMNLLEMNHLESIFERSGTLYVKGSISKEEYEKSESEYKRARIQAEAARFDVLSAEAALKEARENLRKTTITAPISGTISMLNVRIGERVVGTSQMAGTELFRISNMTDMEIVADINENDISQIALKDSVKVDVDAFEGVPFTGHISKISNSSKNFGANSGQVSTFEVRIAISRDDYDTVAFHLLPGMSATGNIITDSRPEARTISVNAIFTKDDKEYVWIVTDSQTVTARQVKCGIRDLNRIEILSGIDDNEIVVCGPYSAITKLIQGVRVKRNEHYNSDD